MPNLTSPANALKVRLIGTVLIRDGICVQSYGFKRFLPIGQPEIAVNFLNRWGIDEIVLLDILATREGRAPDPYLVERCAANSQVPLAVGGGIRRPSDIADLLHAGADKVLINTAAQVAPGLITESSARFGAQCIIVSIDTYRSGSRFDSGSDKVFIEGGQRETETDAVSGAQRAQALGAGEILINAIHCDGQAQGYDIELIRAVASVISIPLIAQGGAGHPRHFAEAIDAGATAVAAANYWHHSEHSVVASKRYLANQGRVSVRLDTEINYAGFTAQEGNGRVAMRDEMELERLRFMPLPNDNSP